MRRIIALLVSLLILNSCYFFRKKDTGEKTEENDNPVLGKPLGSKAGGPDYTALEDLYGISTDHAPAAIRLDPDTYVRRLLLQYRTEGSTVAREIGRVEEYRLLLGGASEDFSKEPQDRYDATSLLASLKVAEEICSSLVAPNSNDHPGWKSILPAKASNRKRNVKYLAQRFTGIHSDELSNDLVNGLLDILDEAVGNGPISNASYIPVCATLAVDAESLLL